MGNRYLADGAQLTREDGQKAGRDAIVQIKASGVGPKHEVLRRTVEAGELRGISQREGERERDKAFVANRSEHSANNCLLSYLNATIVSKRLINER